MLLEIDVIGGGNSPMDLNRVFDLISDPRRITQVFTADPAGSDLWCDVTGWGESGPCPALAALSEDSGEGVVLLIYGGDQGIRLKPANNEEEWDVSSGAQWGEPCLMLGKDTPTRE